MLKALWAEEFDSRYVCGVYNFAVSKRRRPWNIRFGKGGGNIPGVGADSGLKMSLWPPLAATCDDTCVRRKRRNRETVFASGLLRAPLPPLTSSALTRPRHAGFAPSSVSPYRCRTTASRNAAPTCARWRRGRRKAPSCRARRTFRRNASACAETDGKTVFFLRPQMSNKRFQTLR